MQGGLVFGYSAYLNGVFLGSYAGTTSASLSNNVWQIPANTLVVGNDNVLTVLQGVYFGPDFIFFQTHDFNRSYGYRRDKQ